MADENPFADFLNSDEPIDQYLDDNERGRSSFNSDMDFDDAILRNPSGATEAASTTSTQNTQAQDVDATSTPATQDTEGQDAVASSTSPTQNAQHKDAAATSISSTRNTQHKGAAATSISSTQNTQHKDAATPSTSSTNSAQHDYAAIQGSISMNPNLTMSLETENALGDSISQNPDIMQETIPISSTSSAQNEDVATQGGIFMTPEPADPLDGEIGLDDAILGKPSGSLETTSAASIINTQGKAAAPQGSKLMTPEPACSSELDSQEYFIYPASPPTPSTQSAETNDNTLEDDTMDNPEPVDEPVPNVDLLKVSTVPKGGANTTPLFDAAVSSSAPRAAASLSSAAESPDVVVLGASSAKNHQNLGKAHAKPLVIDDIDSDSDLEIIDPKQASLEAQRMWREPKASLKSTPLAPKDVYIKREPKDQTTASKPFPSIFGPAKSYVSQSLDAQALNAQTEEETIAIQQAMLAGILGMDDGNSAAAEATVNGKRSSRKRRRVEEAIPSIEERGQIDAAMRDNDDDHSWMEAADFDAAEEFSSIRKRLVELEASQKAGRITEEETMEYSRLQHKFKVKERVLTAARQEANPEQFRDRAEESLFVSQNDFATGVNGAKRRQVGKGLKKRVAATQPDSDSDFESQSNGEAESALEAMLAEELGPDRVAGSKKPGRKAKPRAKDAREYHAQQSESREKERKKEQRKKGRSGKKGQGQRKSGAAEKVKGKKGRKAAAKSKGKGKNDNAGAAVRPIRKSFKAFNGEDPIGQRILEALRFDYDPIRDRLENPVFATTPEPQISGKQVKTDQFKRLYANIPETSNSRDIASDKKKLKKASMSFGYAKVKAMDGKWMIKGMNSTLYHHQLLGAQWMVERELNENPPHGGLLADSMGLGKTVQTLACMVGNPPGEEDVARKVKATLIVVPGAVIDQWLDEIRYHVKETVFPKIIHYKTKSKIPLAVLKDLDIVVTSYSEVMKQFPFPDDAGRQEIARIGHKKWFNKARKNIGDLHKMTWYRVVLDEAHMIKNNSSRTSLACQNLGAVYRWCLTGTPLLNRIEELFPYLRFLRANYTIDWDQFQRHFCNPETEECNNRISVLLSCTMMRRTMNTTILGRPIITLPPPHPELRVVKFSPEERAIYRITENRFRARLNQLFADKTVQGNYSLFMVQLLRLRQCTSHPFMLERTIKESWTSEDLAELKKQLHKISKNARPFYDQCRIWVEEPDVKNTPEGLAQPAGQAVGENLEVMPFGKSKFGHKFSFDKPIASLNEKELFERVACGVCSDIPEDPCQIDCTHMFCRSCITEVIQVSASEGSDITACPTCDRIFDGFKDFKMSNSQTNDDGEIVDEELAAQTAGLTSKGIDARGFEPKTKDSTWITRSDYEEGFTLAPSAKTTALKAILIKGFNEAPVDKVVIYVQFRLLARIVARICNAENWGFLYLTGDMSLDHRTDAIRMFRDDSEIKILIAGLKCGGLGLNFPWANRCISLDLWWNHAVEQQAFGRIFRIGQNKETYMTRIVVKNSVDTRLLGMQAYKMTACEKAMRDDERADGKETPNLSLKQLANLFGFLREDGEGGILSIEADYSDEEDA